MSWDVSLLDEQNHPVTVSLHEDGGTYPVGGTTEAKLNITYNYGALLEKTLGFHFGELHGRQAQDMIKPLRKAVAILGIYPSDNYWEPTPGNAGIALARLLQWAEQYPNARFEVT